MPRWRYVEPRRKARQKFVFGRRRRGAVLPGQRGVQALLPPPIAAHPGLVGIRGHSRPITPPHQLALLAPPAQLQAIAPPTPGRTARSSPPTLAPPPSAPIAQAQALALVTVPGRFTFKLPIPNLIRELARNRDKLMLRPPLPVRIPNRFVRPVIPAMQLPLRYPPPVQELWRSILSIGMPGATHIEFVFSWRLGSNALGGSEEGWNAVAGSERGSEGSG